MSELITRLRRVPVTVMDGQNITGDAADTIEQLERDKAEILEALNALCNCISETRGPDAHEQYAIAIELIAKHGASHE